MSNENKKYLYSFEVKNDSGASCKFAILKPNRKLKEEGELYYASKLSQFIGSGILPRILWDKMFKDQGGTISEAEKKEYSAVFIELSEAREKIEKLSTKKENERSEEEKGKLLELQAETILLRKRMQDLELSQINAFEYTAEAKARNKSIVWWAANLGVEVDSIGDHKALLNGADIDSKLDYYDEVVESDNFLNKVFSRINYLVTIWYLGSADSFYEFELLDNEFLKRSEEEQKQAEQEEGLDESKKEIDEPVAEAQQDSSNVSVEKL
jgi:hypothetical protein